MTSQSEGFPWFPYHYPYQVATAETLTLVGADQKLHHEAAQAFQRMAAASLSDGIVLLPLSGFRDQAVQDFLFQRQIRRQGSAEGARYLSAPPGHSEHHTGYAVDIGDGNYPDTHIRYSFDRTPAYRWLATHAATYGFELSFPKGNPQGVSYEPWHWRYVGSPAAQAVFAQSRRHQVSSAVVTP